jgi:serine/threonine-protein kinase
MCHDRHVGRLSGVDSLVSYCVMEDSKIVLSEAGGDRADLDPIARLDLGSRLRFDRLIAAAPGALSYLAQEKRRRRPVLLRVIDRQALEEAGTVDALQTSLSEVAALEHLGIVPLYDFGLTAHTVWWTSQFIDTPTLTDVIRAEGALRLDRVLRIAKRVADALVYAHDHGVAHGGVTPETLLIRADDWAVVTDFIRADSWLMGTAPLETRSPGADQRALAVTIYRALTGELDRGARSVLADLATTTKLAGRRPSLPPAVVFSLVRGADPDPYRQFRSPVELVAGLDTQGPQAPVSAPKPTPLPEIEILVPEPDPSLQQGRRLGGRLLAIGLVVVLAFVGLWIGFTRLLDQPSPLAAPPVSASRDSTIKTESSSASPEKAAEPPVVVQAPAPIQPKPTAAKFRPVRHPPPRPIKKIARAKAPTSPATAAPGQPTEQSARLLVRSVPGGTLYIDDRLIGPAIETAIPVSPGHHVVRITRPGYRRYLSMVDVASGEERRLGDVVLQPEK